MRAAETGSGRGIEEGDAVAAVTRAAGGGARAAGLVPALGPQTPCWGNAGSRAFGRVALRVIGWRIEGTIPDVPRLVAIVAPHTASWDFIVGLAALFALGVKVSWLGKHTLFWRPLGSFLRWVGGIPVDRRTPGGIVAQVVERFDGAERLYLALSPEGTRQRTDRWKTGFHRIARAVGAPILPIWLDYRERVIGIGPLLQPSEEVDADLERLSASFVAAMARRPERFARPVVTGTRRATGSCRTPSA